MLEHMKERFENNHKRHPNTSWESVKRLLHDNEAYLFAGEMMEETGGEPDVVEYEGRLLICDCSKETPSGRRSLCYDREARLARKKNTPVSSAVEEAEKMGLRLISEKEYYYLQTLGEFDMKTSSWILTPGEIRLKGGAIFCERRYGRVFTFHNGADSYYGVRAFRCVLELKQK